MRKGGEGGRQRDGEWSYCTSDLRYTRESVVLDVVSSAHVKLPWFVIHYVRGFGVFDAFGESVPWSPWSRLASPVLL